jgi:parallel beta-helix repeat protein
MGGFKLRGRLDVTGNPAGVEISHGTVQCRWKDEGGNAGCVHVNGDGPPVEPLSIHDLTIANTAEEGRGLHIDWPAAGLAGNPTIILERLRVSVPPQPTVSRSYAISVIAKDQFVLASSNDLECNGAARACQALMCYGVGQCKIHHNRIVMQQNTTDENGRAILFDGHTQFGEAWNNNVIVNNNRGIRIRDSRNIRVHHNTFSSITPEQNALAVLHIGDPDIKEPNDLQSSVDENRFLSKGGSILFARGATNFRFANNTVECSPKCPPYSLAQVRGPIYSDLVLWRNKLLNVDEPAISLGPNTKVLLCESGHAAGEGVAEEKCSSRPPSSKAETTERK